MSTRVSLAVLLLPMAVLAGCAADGGAEAAADGSPIAARESATNESSCASTEGMLLAADSAEGEPTFEIPLPSGWEPNSQMNSDLVRLVVSNPTIVRDDFAPSLVVTTERSPADVQSAFDRQLAGLAELTGPSDVETTRGTVCGFESMSFDYLLPEMGTIPERPAKAQIIVVPHGDETLTYSVTAQATSPADPSYEKDVETMLSGIQIND